MGGLPLAHEQAAAYCERLEIGLAEYQSRFVAAEVQMLDARRDAPAEYHDKLTVAKTFALAIEEAAKLPPAAEPLRVHAALLAPEPIPLFLVAEAREKFGEPLASGLDGYGLDEAVAACVPSLSSGARRSSTSATRRSQLIRSACTALVRAIAAARRVGNAREEVRRMLVEALALIYPRDIDDNPCTWPRARRLDGLALAMVSADAPLAHGSEPEASYLMNQLGLYRQRALGDYGSARPLRVRALPLVENAFGLQHPNTATSLDNLGLLLQNQGDLIAARPLFERALAIHENVLGPDHSDVAISLNNLAFLVRHQGDFAAARPLFERALAIDENVLGPVHPRTARAINNLALLLQNQGDLTGARRLRERALAIYEKTFGSDHPNTGMTLNHLA